MPVHVNCPTCNTQVEWDANISPFRPFCSERCKLIDLGEWSNEEKVIQGQPSPEAMQQLSEEDLESLLRQLQSNDDQV